jgi:hypothetical protein
MLLTFAFSAARRLPMYGCQVSPFSLLAHFWGLLAVTEKDALLPDLLRWTEGREALAVRLPATMVLTEYLHGL